MAIKFPTELDTDAELYQVTDDADEVLAAHHNALAEAVKAIEAKLGIDGSAIIDTIDYILNHRVIRTEPPSGSYRVVNFFVNPDNGKLTVEYDDTPTGG
jgi:hypothetical protein